MNIIKRLIEAFATARDFEGHMRIMDSMRSKKQTYKINATKEQMGILRYIAATGFTINEFEKAYRCSFRNNRDEISGD